MGGSRSGPPTPPWPTGPSQVTGGQRGVCARGLSTNRRELLHQRTAIGRVVDPHSFFAYPNPAVFLIEDPDRLKKLAKQYLMKSFL